MSSWADWIPLIIGTAGAVASSKNAKSPDVPEALDYRQILNLIMQNQNSPFGSTTYTEGQDGRITRDYQFSPQVQPAFDRLAYRAANPDQAYQLPPQLQQLQQALMNQRLERMGITPQTGGGGGQSQPNFTVPGASYTSQSPDTPSGVRNPDITQFNANQQDSRTAEPGNRNARDAGFTPQGDPWYGINGNANWMPEWMRQPTPGTDADLWWGENADEVGKWLGRGVGAATGFPLSGTLGEFFGNLFGDQIFDQHYFQSDNPPGHSPNALDGLNHSIVNDPRNMGVQGSSPWRPEVRGVYGNTVGVTDQRGNPHAGMRTDFNTQWDWAHGNSADAATRALLKAMEKAKRNTATS